MSAPATIRELLDVLTLERYGQVVHEWHPPRPSIVEEDARALRLVVDNATMRKALRREKRGAA